MSHYTISENSPTGTLSASLKEMPKAKNDHSEKDMETEWFKIGSQALWAFELKKDDLSHIEEIV